MLFPKNFIFGIADADLQVIGEDKTLELESSEKTVWMHYARHSGKAYQNQTPGPGIDRYSLWQKDIQIMKELGLGHYRTSISMSRTLHQNGTVNSKAIKWYETYFKALKKNKIKIYATLYHWELPQYLQEQGGWENEKSGDYLVKHSEIAAKYLGEYIEEYFILNEPWCSSILSYFLGIHAPGITSLKSGLLAAHCLLVAQGKVYKTLRAISKDSKISTVYNVEPSYAKSTNPKDILASKYADGSFNRWFLDPLYKGKYPEDMLELYGQNVPSFSEHDMEIIKIGNKLHSLGLNYYKGSITNYDSSNILKYSQDNINKKGKVNGLGWPIYEPPYYPDGLYDILAQVYYSYKDYGLKSLYVTENGMAWKDKWDRKSSVVDDPERVSYYKEHLKQVNNAITRGIPVNGYFAWTFMDNYEWAEGYRDESRFGLVYIDRPSMKRILKKSALWYKELIKNHNLDE
jgi:beta-glucosidase